jgi:hypothetical protein
MADNGEPLKPVDFGAPMKRKCTDVLFMLLLVAAWVAMTAIGIDSIKKGNPDRLINGVDTQGRICGVDAGVQALSKLYYINLDGSGVCTASCPKTTDFNNLYACNGTDAQYQVNGTAQLACTGADAQKCAQLTGISNTSDISSAKGFGTCMYQIQSVDVLNRCVYFDAKIASSFVKLGSTANYMQHFLSDIYQARNWILGFGFGFSFVLGFVYCMLLRIPGVVTLLTWGSICATIALFAAVGYGFWQLSITWKQDTTNQYQQWQVRTTNSNIFCQIFAAL